MAQILQVNVIEIKNNGHFTPISVHVMTALLVENHPHTGVPTENHLHAGVPTENHPHAGVPTENVRTINLLRRYMFFLPGNYYFVYNLARNWWFFFKKSIA
jgi:hypothetical protein